MSRPRTPRNNTDPRHRYNAMLAGARAPISAHEVALDHLLNGTALPADFHAETLEAVEAALGTFDSENARRMFDACLMGRATTEELEEAFEVSPAEAEAYSHLFFDRSIFSNSFHAIAYAASVVDEGARALLKEAYTKGFRAIRFKYASEKAPPTADVTIQRMLEADSHQYMEQRELPLSDKRMKDLRALGKHVLAEAHLLTKVTAPAAEAKSAAGDNERVEFVIQSGPLNPTLEELLSKGVEIIH